MLGGVLTAYARDRRLHFPDRDALQRHQERSLSAFRRRVLVRSPYFAAFADRPWEAWPRMDKASMMQHFDRMNTAGLQRDTLWDVAMNDERSRRFGSTWNGYSVGLSSGTSGQRALFVAGVRERSQWAGTVLARLLPHLLPVPGARPSSAHRQRWQRERVALFLRSGNSLYSAVRNPVLSFTFFDLFEHFESQWPRLDALDPTVIVAPAQVLRALALAKQAGQLRLPHARVVSVAEVLEADDRELLTQVFGRPDEVYQATEGFLGVTCAHGNLHLNEAYIKVEPEWLDAQRFVPVITDFTRTTQPIVRYRLDDVLRTTGRGCTCGDPSMVIDAIEGRCNDMLILPGAHGADVRVFADAIARVMALSLPRHADWRLRQKGGRHVCLDVTGECADIAVAQHALEDLLIHQGVDVGQLHWQLGDTIPAADFMHKRRRIRREAA